MMRSMPVPKPMPGVGLPAEQLDQAVVAAAAADRALRALLRRRYLEDGARVVVEAAHEARVEGDWDAGGIR